MLWTPSPVLCHKLYSACRICKGALLAGGLYHRARWTGYRRAVLGAATGTPCLCARLPISGTHRTVCCAALWLCRLAVHANLLDVSIFATELRSLGSLELSGGCRLLSRDLPPSLTHLAVPCDVGFMAGDAWPPGLAGLPALRQLHLTCQGDLADLGDPDDMVHDWFQIAPKLDLKALQPLQQLEVLVVDCSEVSMLGGPEVQLSGAVQALPPGLRSLTLTHLGHASLPFLQSLAALPKLASLRLPACRLVGVPRVLAGLTGLEELELGGCGAGGVGASLEPLRALPRLRRLWLQDCDLRQLLPGELRGGWPALQASESLHTAVRGLLGGDALVGVVAGPERRIAWDAAVAWKCCDWASVLSRAAGRL
jgi:hypothetical protein